MDCPLYKENLKRDIEHIDEIEDITYKCLLKNKLRIPRTEQDNKELKERIDSMKNVLTYKIGESLCESVDYMMNQQYNNKLMNKLGHARW